MSKVNINCSLCNRFCENCIECINCMTSKECKYCKNCKFSLNCKQCLNCKDIINCKNCYGLFHKRDLTDIIYINNNHYKITNKDFSVESIFDKSESE